MSRSEPKVHLRRQPSPLARRPADCGALSLHVTDDPEKVTCARCLLHIAARAAAKGEAPCLTPTP